MKIKDVTIENFRSYYGSNHVKFNDGLMLFVGDNGDGKTTFFEAMEWLFDTTRIPSRDMDSNLISQKKIAEIIEGEDIGILSVSMTFEHDGSEKFVEKSFSFKKVDDKIKTDDFKFEGFYNEGSEREQIDGATLLDRCFDPAIRKYCLFKGEGNLNVLNNADALNYLVETFSNVRQFNPYYTGNEDNPGFTEKAERKSNKAYTDMVQKDKKTKSKGDELNQQIIAKRNELSKIRERLKTHRKSQEYYQSKIDNNQYDPIVAGQLKSITEQIYSKKEDKVKKLAAKQENYSIYLLDEMWILCAFPKIFEDFQKKVNDISLEKRKKEDEYNRQKGKSEAYRDLFVPLPVNIPDASTMQEMIDAHVCKVCGRPAEPDSDAYKFMVKRMNELRESVCAQHDEHKSLFPNNFAEELKNRSIHLECDQQHMNSLNQIIKDRIDLNKRLSSEIDQLTDEIEQLEDQKKKILANAKAGSELDYKNALVNITEWSRELSTATVQITIREREEKDAQDDLDNLQKQFDALAKGSQAYIYGKVHTAFDKIMKAFKFAKEKNTKNFLALLQNTANMYLEKLNTEGFHGLIHIYEDREGCPQIRLQDENGIYQANPNEALKTTMYMSVLFAISELTSERRDDDYPLIFDAPTSSFAPRTEADFFKVISEVQGKQCVIFTKSFLNENGDIDPSKTDSLHCTILRLIKEKPFNQQNLSTIATKVIQIQ